MKHIMFNKVRMLFCTLKVTTEEHPHKDNRPKAWQHPQSINRHNSCTITAVVPSTLSNNPVVFMTRQHARCRAEGLSPEDRTELVCQSLDCMHMNRQPFATCYQLMGPSGRSPGSFGSVHLAKHQDTAVGLPTDSIRLRHGVVSWTRPYNSCRGLSVLHVFSMLGLCMPVRIY